LSRAGAVVASVKKADMPTANHTDASAVRPYSEALAWIARLQPVAEVMLPPSGAIGAVAAQDIRAPAAIPVRAVALLDGIAVTAIETVGASASSPVFPASPPVVVRAGDVLPGCCDAVRCRW
jgi:molybdopterin molybdotransferase